MTGDETINPMPDKNRLRMARTPMSFDKDGDDPGRNELSALVQAIRRAKARKGGGNCNAAKQPPSGQLPSHGHEQAHGAAGREPAQVI